MDRQQGANSTNDTRPPASALVASSDPDLEFSFSRQGERDIPLSNRGIAFRFLMTLIVQIIGISAAIIFGIWSGKSYNIGKEALAAAQQANSFALAIPSATKANDATMALTIVPVVQANKSELSSRPDSQQSTAFSVSTTEPKPPFLTHPAGAVPTNLEEDVFSSAPRVAVAFEGSGNLPAFTTPSKVGFKEPATITTLLVHDTMLASPSVETPILPWSYALLGEMRLANQINLWRLCSDNAQVPFPGPQIRDYEA
ncbi:MAG: hypothetical protein M1814_001477 [Vezdaea aestivalis]|nr:MAG: hypothetical protein M1814_001477 [Vezdaea aestivalis]